MEKWGEWGDGRCLKYSGLLGWSLGQGGGELALGRRDKKGQDRARISRDTEDTVYSTHNG